MKQHEDRYE